MTHHFYFKRGARAEVLCGAVPQTQPHSLSLLLGHGLAVDMGNLCSPPGSFAEVQQGLGALCSIPSRVIWITLKDFCSISWLSSGCSPLMCSCCFPPSYHSLPIIIILHLSPSSCIFHLPLHLAKKIPFVSDQVASIALHTLLSFESLLLMLK